MEELQPPQEPALPPTPTLEVPPSPPPKPERTLWDSVKENIETFVVAIIAALFIRQYLLEPYKIPTGSMGPALHGVHRDIRCPHCGTVFETGCDDPPDSPSQLAFDARNEVSCPVCNVRTDLGKGRVMRGDKILANKLVYLFRPPKRWEVVVFHAAAANKTYIKRLAGLPGEKLEIKHGDLYVNDRITERPPEVQAAMRIPVYDLGRDDPGKYGEHWRFDPLRVKREGGGFTLGGTGWTDLTYANEITDWLCYDDWSKLSMGRFQPTPVGDIRVEMDCELPAGAGIGCEIREDNHLYRWTLGAGGAGFEHALLQAPVSKDPLPDLAPGKHHLVFNNIDDVQTLEVDGKLVRRWTIPSGDEGDPASGVRILGHGGVRVTALAIARDNAYTQDGEGRQGHPLVVPPGRYFFLGDNSPISQDSRKWPQRDDLSVAESCTVPESDILGKAFLAVVHLDWPWDVPLKDLSCHWIR